MFNQSLNKIYEDPFPFDDMLLDVHQTSTEEDDKIIIRLPTTSTEELKATKKIDSLISKSLKKEIDITIENDGDGFIAKSITLPLYGFADSPTKAIENLKHEIESCYYELLSENDFSEEWLKFKSYLIEIIE
ncbi:MAG: hypothetical protein JXB26_01380 [Candidatus Aminicenantes bacterium]|nr:hypothetical protein [Candidatus Aminicenantes bacterium]